MVREELKRAGLREEFKRERTHSGNPPKLKPEELRVLEKEEDFISFQDKTFTYKAGWDGKGWNIYEVWETKTMRPVFAHGSPMSYIKYYLKPESLKVLGLPERVEISQHQGGSSHSGNPKEIPAAEASKSSTDRHPTTLEQLVAHPRTLAAVLVQLARDPRTPVAVLGWLARDPDWEVRSGVAKNPHTPAAVLEQLAADPDWHMRSAVAQNPNTPPAVLERLAHDKVWSVRLAVARHPNTPPEVLARLGL